ncbi:MAG TPA: YihY/virulence factor BrkB family protein, partial [Parasegetibacter sp.]
MKKKKTLRITNLERRIITSSPVRFIIRKSKRIILPGMDGIPLFDVSRFFFRQLNTVGINERAAAISFNFLMAIPATMIFLFTLVPYLPISKQFTQELLILAKDLTPNYSTYQVVRDFLNDFLNTPRTGLLSFGFLLVIYYSSNAMMGIMQSFDRSLVSLKKRNFLQSRWIAIKLTFIFLILIIAAVLVLITQGKILEWVLGQLNADSPAVRILVKGLR